LGRDAEETRGDRNNLGEKTRDEKGGRRSLISRKKNPEIDRRDRKRGGLCRIRESEEDDVNLKDNKTFCRRAVFCGHGGEAIRKRGWNRQRLFSLGRNEGVKPWEGVRRSAWGDGSETYKILWRRRAKKSHP